MPKYFVPFTYLNILYPSFQCDSFGISMNLEISLTPYIILGLVVVRYIRWLTSLLNSVRSTLHRLYFLLNFNNVMTGVSASFEFTILNLFNISCAYLDCEITIPVLD
jgi:hypothetical protein